MKNLTQSITKAQLIAEIAEFADETEIIINIGRKNYSIETVITGNGKIYLETSAKIGRTAKFKTDAERYAFHNANKKNKAS